jgi:endonuclease YncB( thermonuclease family)
MTWIGYLCLLGALGGCDREATAEAPSGAGLELGTFALTDNGVIDGDTIRVRGLGESIRLLSLDTEEVFHGKREREEAERDFAAYRERKRAESARPPKFGSPLGEAAADFARNFFEGVESVRLVRDNPKEIYGHFGRYLAYAFVEQKGAWVNYNVECVRAGMSPYFTKYGYSERFHEELVKAEAEARKAERGIWNRKARGYGDYDQRIAWWNARADFIQAFERDGDADTQRVSLGDDDAGSRLEAKLGTEVSVMSTLGSVRHFKGLVRVELDMPRDKVFPIIFFDKEVFRQSGIEDFRSEPVRVRGTIERYEKGDYRTLQIVVRDPSQVTLPRLPFDD